VVVLEYDWVRGSVAAMEGGGKRRANGSRDGDRGQAAFAVFGDAARAPGWP